MKLPTLTQAAKGEASFLRYEGYPSPTLWYRLVFLDEDNLPDTLDFPIACADSGAGTFDREMKGIHVLRWARKRVELLQGVPPEPPPARPDGGMASR